MIDLLVFVLHGIVGTLIVGGFIAMILFSLFCALPDFPEEDEGPYDDDGFPVDLAA